MSSKITQKTHVPLIAYHSTKGIVRVKDTICFRKPLDKAGTKKVMRRYKHAIGMMSAHNIYRKPNTRYCKVWCHCLRDPEKYFKNKPCILLSESDFVDPFNTRTRERGKQFKWDFYYFTIGGGLGADYKGVDLFAECLPAMCEEYGLRGVVIKYARTHAPYKHDKRQRARFARNRKYLTMYSGKMNPRRMASIMAKSRFGFFPNKTDCSPLMLTESLVRNCPILVNKQILGGWKYVNEKTGCLFRRKSIREALEIMLNTEFDPRNAYMESGGYKNTSIRLAEFCKQHIPSFSEYRMVAFAGTEHIMEHYAQDL